MPTLQMPEFHKQMIALHQAMLLVCPIDVNYEHPTLDDANKAIKYAADMAYHYVLLAEFFRGMRDALAMPTVTH